jgi:hypothetical protein
MPASASPTTIGLYINSISISATDTSPYTNLLGTDGLGNNPAGGNKIDDLIAYMVAMGYNYALFYGLAGSAFIGGNPDGAASEVFSATGKARLQNIIQRFTDAGIDTGAICDVFLPNESVPRTDGTSQVRKIIDYNNYVASDEQFKWINFETEFWRFPHGTATSTSGQKVQTSADGLSVFSDWFSTLDPPEDCPTGQTVLTNITANPNDFIKIKVGSNIYYRQIITKSVIGGRGRAVTLDRALPVSARSQNCVDYVSLILPRAEVDYATFLYRLANCRTYVDANDTTGIKLEAYVGFPNYTVDGPAQLAKLYADSGLDPILDRVLPAAYGRIPNFNASGVGQFLAAVNGGSTPRITGDILPNITGTRELGFIISAESPTLNAGGCDDTVSSYQGYFLEGRTLATNSDPNQLFLPLNSPATQVPASLLASFCGGACCASGTIAAPSSGLYSPKSLQDVWDYTLTYLSQPVNPLYPPHIPKTYNKMVADGDISGGEDAKLNWTTLVVFDQELIRQLVTDPPIPLIASISGTNASCDGVSDGTATAVVTSGTSPYTYTWYKNGVPYTVDGPTSSTTSTIVGLEAGLYACDIEDDDANTYAVAVSVLEPAVPVWNMTATDGNCAGEDGSIEVEITSWTTGTYTYTPTDAYIQLSGDSTWFVLNAGNSWTKTYTGLTAGAYGGTLSLNSPGNSCDYTDTASINAGTNITAAIVAVFQPECFTSTRFTGVEVSTNSSNFPITHSITFTNSGLTYTSGPINLPVFAWSNLPYQVTAASDTITYTATDGLGCTDTDSITFNLPTEIDVNILTTQPTCTYSGDGSINLTVNGGKTPYSYLWSNGETTQDINNLYAGIYSYTITDDNGCQITGTVTLTAPTPIILSTTVVQIPEGETTGGSISVDSVSGGTAPYTYLWSTGDTTNAITNLSVGTYTVTVTDDNGCETTKTFNLYVRCDAFDLTELKVAIYKAQCCAGKKAQQYIKYLQAGREDLALCKRDELRFLTMAIDALYCITDLSTGCFTCEQIKNILDQIAKYCDCDCCEEADTEQAKVDWDIDNNKFNIIE